MMTAAPKRHPWCELVTACGWKDRQRAAAGSCLFLQVCVVECHSKMTNCCGGHVEEGCVGEGVCAFVLLFCATTCVPVSCSLWFSVSVLCCVARTGSVVPEAALQWAHMIKTWHNGQVFVLLRHLLIVDVVAFVLPLDRLVA